MSDPRLLSIQVGKPQAYEATAEEVSDKPWRTAFFKQAVTGPILAGSLGLTGDGQEETEVHGGPDKAICVYSNDHHAHWQRAIGVDDLAPAPFGENFSIEGLVETDVYLGDVWQIGSARFQISQPRQPCWKLARRWGVKDLALQVKQNGYTGWYLRVLTEGNVEAGDAIKLVDRPLPEWPLSRANEVMHQLLKDRDAAVELAAIELLSESWKEQLFNRIEKLDVE